MHLPYALNIIIIAAFAALFGFGLVMWAREILGNWNKPRPQAQPLDAFMLLCSVVVLGIPVCLIGGGILIGHYLF